MTVLYLVRHGLTDAVGARLSGRSPGIPLNEVGRRQAARVARLLSSVAPVAIFSSPLQRARETAQAIANPLGLPVQELPELTDIDFGAWTNAELSDLEQDPTFSYFNRRRSLARPPRGESLWEVQAGMAGALLQLSEGLPSATAVVVSHADPLRAALCHLLGFPLDLSLRLDIRPGSVSRVEIAGDCVLSLLNHVPGEFDDCGGDKGAPPQQIG